MGTPSRRTPGRFVVAATTMATSFAGRIPNAYAGAHAHTPSISGNWLWAVGLVVVGITILVMLVRGALALDERDAWMRRGGGDGNDWTFPD